MTLFYPCVCLVGMRRQQSFGDGPQKKALSRRFKSYSWIFTDALIDKLVELKAEDAARSRAMGIEAVTAAPLLSGREGGQDGDRVDRGEPQWRAIKRERRKYKSDIMREMTAGSGSSKDLLGKVVGSWLPGVLAADEAAERRVNEASA